MSLELRPQKLVVLLEGAEGRLALGSEPPALRLQLTPVLAGMPGAAVELRQDAGWIQWRQVGAAEWINLVALAALEGEPGDAGPAVELQVAGGFIQWRVVGATSWINLVALAEIQGAPGPAGQTGGANIDGGRPDSVYGGTEPIDGGTP